MCEKPMTCAGHGQGLVSGLYPITLPSGQELKVYCDFQSQPGFVWTLIESFALAEKDRYVYKSFTLDFPVNQESLNWRDYRLSRSVMQHLKSNATLWRATCRYDTDGLVTTDYIRGLLTNTDILTYVSDSKCAHVQHINVRGISCSECTAHFYQSALSHAFVDSGYGISLGCQWDGRVGAVESLGSWDDNFGKYGTINLEHRCSSSSASTTQWWLGTQV